MDLVLYTYIENINHNFNHVRRMGNKLRLKPGGVQFFMYEVVLKLYWLGWYYVPPTKTVNQSVLIV